MNAQKKRRSFAVRNSPNFRIPENPTCVVVQFDACCLKIYSEWAKARRTTPNHIEMSLLTDNRNALCEELCLFVVDAYGLLLLGLPLKPSGPSLLLNYK